jgi:membrane glycosyltransferase
VRRDLRWCQGNLQYLKLLRPADLHPVSRVNLALATGGFIGSTAWVLLMVLFALPMALDSGPSFLPGPGLAVFTVEHGHGLRTEDRRVDRGRLECRCPPTLRRRSATPARGHRRHAVLRPDGADPRGGPCLLHRRADVRAGRGLGAQRRTVHWVGPLAALRRLWPQTLFGIAGVSWFWYYSPPGALFFSPFFAIAGLAVLIAVITSIRRSDVPSPGSALAYSGRDAAPVPLVADLHLPAVPHRQPRRSARLGEPSVTETAE